MDSEDKAFLLFAALMVVLLSVVCGFACYEAGVHPETTTVIITGTP